MGDIVAPTVPEPPMKEPLEAKAPKPQDDGYVSVARLIRKGATPEVLESVIDPAPKEEEPKNGAAPILKVEPPKLTPKVEPTASPNRENFKRLEEAKTAAEKERDTLRQEVESFKKRSTDLEQTLAKARERDGNVAGLELTIQKQTQELDEMRREVKAASLQRDPEFREKYETGRNFHADRLIELGQQAGATKEDMQRLVRAGDADRLAEVASSLPPGQQARFMAALTEIERLDSQREQELKNAEGLWERLQREKQEKQRQNVLQQNAGYRQIGHKAVERLFNEIPGIKENEQLRTEALAAVDGVAGFGNSEKWTPENMMGNIALAQIMVPINLAQQTIIQHRDEEITALKEEKERLEATIKSHGFDDSEPGFGGNGREPEEYVSLGSRIKVAGR